MTRQPQSRRSPSKRFGSYFDPRSFGPIKTAADAAVFYWAKVQFASLLREVDLRRHFRSGFRRVVFVLRMEPSNVCPDAVRELLNESIIIPNRFIVPPAGYGYPIFCAGQLILQAHELVVALELRVVFLQPHQGQQSDV